MKVVLRVSFLDLVELFGLVILSSSSSSDSSSATVRVCPFAPFEVLAPVDAELFLELLFPLELDLFNF